MYTFNSNFSTNYPRLEDVLETLSTHLVPNLPPEFSRCVDENLIEGVRNLLDLAHGRAQRKSGGFYLEEHIAVIGELGITLGLPPYAVLGLLLHDFVEDNENILYSRKDKEQIQREEKLQMRYRNFGKLDQQLFGGLQRGPGFLSLDKRILMTQVGFATKPLLEDVKYLDFGDSFYNSDKRFAGKVFRSLGKYLYSEETQLAGGIQLTHASSFYVQLTVLLDMYLNMGIFEQPREDLSLKEKKSFRTNKERNLRRMIAFLPQLDTRIRDKISEHNHCFIDSDAYSDLIKNQVIRQVEFGIKKFDSRLDRNFRRFLSTYNDYVQNNYT